MTAPQSTGLWLAAPPPHPALEAVVIVPARNEAEGLPATLAALAGQRDLHGKALDRRRFEVLLLANNCDDDSAALARRFARRHAGFALHVEDIQLPPPDAHIGTVRRLLMDAACRRLQASHSPHCVIASTDADTVVAPDWLASTLAEFSAGADAVGGRILLHRGPIMAAHTLRRQRCDAAYRLAVSRLEDALDPDPADPWPRHHQHFCASLAISRAAYVQVGGVPVVRYLEDEALVNALRLADLRIRHSPLVRVHTSARHRGRVEVGLSWQLRQWSADTADAAMWVDDVDHLALKIQSRRQLRQWHQEWRSGYAPTRPGALAAVAQCFDVAPAWLEARARSAATFGALWADVQACCARTPAPPPLPVRQAIDRLHSLIGLHAHLHGGQHATHPAVSHLARHGGHHCDHQASLSTTRQISASA